MQISEERHSRQEELGGGKALEREWSLASPGTNKRSGESSIGSERQRNRRGGQNGNRPQ